MPTLLLRLAGPMQSWGIASRFSHRDTAREPSKSGVIGLLCAALGASRQDDALVATLAAMPMGVRVDREGRLEADYHTVGAGTVAGARYGVARAAGASLATVVSTRDYLADADFLVGLQGDDVTLLHRLDAALRSPRWPLCLGRRCFVPGVAPAVGVVMADLEPALTQWPYMRRGGVADLLRVVLDGPPGVGEARYDVPVSFDRGRRDFRPRTVITRFIPVPRLGGRHAVPLTPDAERRVGGSAPMYGRAVPTAPYTAAGL